MLKSIKQQYIDLREGNMSQANFMRNLRMTLPQYVTNVTSFEDSVRILKNKGILTEADMNENTSIPTIQDIEEALRNIFEDGLIDDIAWKTASKALDNFDIKSNMNMVGPTTAEDLAKELVFIVTGEDVQEPEDDYDADYEEPRDDFPMSDYNDGEFWESLNENTSIPTIQDIEEALRNIFEDGLIDDIAWKTASKALDNFDIKSNMNMVGPTTAEDLAKELVFIVTGEDVQEPEDDYDADYEEPNEPFDMAESLNEAKDEKTKWTNTSSKSMYDAFKEIDNLNAQEVLIGLDWEMEKNPELTKVAAAKIVIKNLKKNPIYYTAADMSGVEGYEPEYIGGKSAQPEARQMQYLDKNMGNVVDKKMGMQPVKGVEKPKKDSDKGGETNKAEKNIKLMSLIAKTVRGMKKMDATGEKMKKIVMKEGMEGQYTFNGYFKGGELDKLKTMIPDAEIDDQVEYGQGAKTTVLSQQHSDEEIKKAVDSVIGMNEDKVASTIFDKNANITKGVNDIAKGKLTKERLKELIRQEIAGAYGGDQMDAEDGSSYTND